MDFQKIFGISRLIKTSMDRPLIENDKVVTRKTIDSIEVKTKVHLGTSIEWEVWAGGGYKYIQFGKKANTKLPVKKVNGKFQLVDDLANWKKALGITIPDFLLARTIAKNPRRGVDLIGSGIRIMEISGVYEKIMEVAGEDVLTLLTQEMK